MRKSKNPNPGFAEADEFLDQMRREIANHKGHWPTLARDSGIPYWSIVRFYDGSIRRPSIAQCWALGRCLGMHLVWAPGPRFSRFDVAGPSTK